MTPDDRPFAVASRPPGWGWGKRVAVWGAGGFLGLMTLVALVSTSVTVPDVVGDNLPAAASAISSAGLRAAVQGPSGQTVATTESSWHVAGQQPTAGATVSSGATVTLQLQTASPETTPSSTSRSLDDRGCSHHSEQHVEGDRNRVVDAADAEHFERGDGDATLDGSRLGPQSAGLDTHQVDCCRSARERTTIPRTTKPASRRRRRPVQPPRTTRALPPKTTTRAAPTPKTTPPQAAYYPNCAAARAAGAAPLYRGEPGYRAGLDRDDDGVACET